MFLITVHDEPKRLALGKTMSNTAAPEAKRKGKRKPIVVIGLVVPVLLIGVALWLSGILGHFSHYGAKAASVADVEKPTFIDLPDIVSNLDTGGHKATFIKLHAKIEIMHSKDAVALQAALPQVLDVFQAYLRSTRPDELRGGEGTYRLREALVNRLEAVLSPIQVTDLLFTELLVQ